ncbi:hypothetical protein C2S53_017633 [Perilla frutescens var. hirtella]|uniref:Protein CHUP1, chloroplastic n=1 Tax=Perilla frutescens var. hirtella TaxID=608512 RepID=A0AAD4IT85_PERFH|nr:hypothetical protein C2S53_017633 [Perilla frutescens var. hirtella]
MEVKDTREISTNLKFGLAVALSLGGALYTYHRIKNIKFPPGRGGHVDSRAENGDLKNNDRANLQKPSHRKILSQNSISDVSSSRSVDRDCFLLEEFNESKTKDLCPKKNADSLFNDIDYQCVEEEEHEREIRRLRNRVKILEEKERNLELQLLEYYGIKEQENAVIELQNRLRLNTMEAKLYNLKIESLLLDNRRLEAQAADYANSSAELESAKSKVKLLRKKLKSEGERNKDQIMKLQERLMMMQEQEKRTSEIDRELKMQLEEACELKLELEEMKKCNEILKLENIELAQKLEYVQMLAENAVDNDEMLEVKEESRRLKQENEESKDEIERLKTDRCTDLEELVFLRWINACLRNELKNYQPAGKNIARNLSPKSEEKAKKLILEYANKEAKGIDTNYLESDQWSSSQTSCMTDERDELPADLPSANKAGKPKLFGKLRRLLLGKSSRRSQGQTPPPSGDNLPGRLSCDFPAGSPRVVDVVNDDIMKASRILSRSGSRRSFDVPRSYSRGNKSMAAGSSNGPRRSNADDASTIINRIEALTKFDSSWSPAVGMQGDQNDNNDELLKFAEAWKNSHTKKLFRSPSSFDSS